MHGLMLTILVTGFVIEGARMAVTETGTAACTLVAGRHWSGRHGALGYRRGRAAAPAQTDLVVPPAPGHGLHRPHSLHQIPPYPHHQRQLSLRRSRSPRQTRQPRSGKRGQRDLRRHQPDGPDLEGYLRRRCLHPLQALPGPLPGLCHRQTAVADEGRQPDRRGRLQQPGGQPHRTASAGRPSGPARPAGPVRRSARPRSSTSARSSRCAAAWC